ncbi:hypothetical protein D3C78_1375280 [compost metagenome]
MHQGADAFHRTAFAGGDFRGMDERGAVQADVDEGRLHARQHPHHLALVDVADDAALLRALDMHLLQHAVFHHRHARLHGGDVDQNFFAHLVILVAGDRPCVARQGRASGCQQATPNSASSAAVSASGRPTTAE